MSYTTPTSAEFLVRFPIFEDKDTALIDMLLLEATNSIDQSWREEDYQIAIMYLTAHLLSTDNSEEGTDVEFGSEGGGAIASESFGGMSISYASPASANSGVSSQYSSTIYGRRFAVLLKNNRPGVVAI
jgi:hypothetical protein